MSDRSFLSAAEIRQWQVQPPPASPQAGLAAARAAMHAAGVDGPSQQMGRRWPIGCVALEITQRCNLDCTACYLSEHSEAVRDLPLPEIFRRIDLIVEHYGPGTDVQVTGGDPTLRDAAELVAIVARITARGLRATLMTNGIRATAPLLRRLASAGLVDVAFHVDTTQERKGFVTEASLNRLRERYIASARSAGLCVMFNTTVHTGNFAEMPALARFFRRHAGAVRTASFQLQADTGRGRLRERAEQISIESTIAALEHGTGARIGFDVSQIGHPRCTRYGLVLCVGNATVSLFEDPRLVEAVQAATVDLTFSRGQPWRTGARLAGRALRHPALAARALAWGLTRVLPVLPGWLRDGGPLATQSFVIHDFMDAPRLDRDRICACVFKVMTAAGPVSMCLHNAARDAFILEPVQLAPGRAWDPLSGRPTETALVAAPDPLSHPLRRLKGRSRQLALAARREERIAKAGSPGG